tara:strand:- start:153 stop:1145 length:993 start_codon:yes stop_codon:yes gene_type:complete
MDDLVWRTGISSIARYVPSDSDQVGVNTFARLEGDEVCGYQVGGVYVQNYSESTPNLKPKPGLISRIFRGKPPERDHLFVSKGPHKLLMSFNSRWDDEEDRPLLALITITIAPSNISKLFSTARDAEDHVVTPPVLISAIHAEVSTRFNEYVGKLNSPDSWETADDIKRIENEFKMIADSELSHLGVNVERVALNLGDSKTQNLVSLEKNLGQVRKRGVIESVAGFDRSYDEMSGSQTRLLSSIGARSESEAATGQEAEEVIEITARARLDSMERMLLEQISEVEADSIHSRKLRDIERKGLEQRQEMKRIGENKAMVDSLNDNADDQAE